MPNDVDLDKIEAHYEDGVLSIALPKLERARPKSIEIQTDQKSPIWKKLLGLGQPSEDEKKDVVA